MLGVTIRTTKVRTWESSTPPQETQFSTPITPTSIAVVNLEVHQLKAQRHSDPDFLNTSLLFYNEKAEPVCVYVRDSLDTKKLGYVFQSIDIPWLKSRPKPLNKKVKSKKSIAASIVPFGVGAALDEKAKSIHLRIKMLCRRRNNWQEKILTFYIYDSMVF
ncbi:polyphenol oxidase C, chloroplastic-like [Cucumis sativus]|uniref:Polyphenol oxidase central domain-containing protein n=1 Tax=Cucumis sativus TaxID=3659 RepID=A0A0A0LSA5_CUCSA|nr:polyphenol oxidase C, chloroplastic-like [Cucumis sativus]KGN64653.1 hypothetical protein Csa_013139 [Cucumis sativus]